MTYTLREYIQKLRDEAINRAAITQNKTPLNLVDEYTHSITQWVSSQTPTQLTRPFTLMEIASLSKLAGLNSANPSNQYVSQAARRCGFVNRRNWTISGRNKRYWLYKGEMK